MELFFAGFLIFFGLSIWHSTLHYHKSNSESDNGTLWFILVMLAVISVKVLLGIN